MARKKKLYCCCCPTGNDALNLSHLPLPINTRLGVGLFSPNGVLPDVVQTLDPYGYLQTQERLRDDGPRCKPVGFTPDPLYPSDSRSDCRAYTPIYRGGQNSTLQYLDKNSFHGVNGNNTAGGVYYDWDGVTTKSVWYPSTYTTVERDAFRQDWYDWLFPQDLGSNYCCRGLKQLYESTLPFKDEYNPTVSEFESWNLIVMNHVRKLLELPPASYDPTIFLNCKWSDERKFTTMWDTEYPGTFDSAYGPCSGGTNLHCGETFAPTVLDEQSPYWNSYYCKYPCVSPPALVGAGTSYTAGLETLWNGTAMTCMSRLLRNKCVNGNITGHGPPFFFREKWGYSIYGTGGGGIRSKWTGAVTSPPSGYSY